MTDHKFSIIIGTVISVLLIQSTINFPHGAVGSYDANEPNVIFPGSDTDCDIKSPFTLPQGRGYLENHFISIATKGNCTPFQYNWPFLLRFGVTDSIELRFGGQGITYVSPMTREKRMVGFSPLIIDCKVHLSGSPDDLWKPATGLELYLQTPLASKKLKMGTQFGINLLALHQFPHKISFCWNAGFGFSSLKKCENADDIFASINGCLMKAMTSSLLLFVGVMYNTKISNVSPQTLELETGWEWIITQRFALFSAFGGTLFHDTNPYLFNLGFIVAY